MKCNIKKWQLSAIIITVCFLGLLIIGSFFAKDKQAAHKNTQWLTERAKQTPYEPCAFVVLDPGHGGFDGGAVGIESGTPEDVINLSVAKMTESLLEEHNIEVTLTRDDNNALAETKKDDMKLRRSIMHKDGITLTVSIHMNKFKDRSIHGPMVFYTAGDEPSEQLARFVMDSICTEIGAPNRHTNPGDYYVIKESTIPAIIVECGFLSNADEERKLCKEDYQYMLAKGIAQGIIEYLDI